MEISARKVPGDRRRFVLGQVTRALVGAERGGCRACVLAVVVVELLVGERGWGGGHEWVDEGAWCGTGAVGVGGESGSSRCC